ncbi:PREDICTED: uncharacterized protein LOC104781641 [Camelina sativa]|uniref:Uncharacterized protein LOC104781641 n=1 Tax=Camelina sativa TaxID=90675 RepID=A0ABM1RL43_CAMSA|nr:PREDICTED: uncharacterized protein LOC104781641 [Camelina sativa]
MMQVWRDCCRGCKRATVVTDHVERRTRCSHCGLEIKYHSVEDGVDVKENDTVRRLSDPPISNSGLSIVTTRSTTDPANGSFVDFLSPNLEDSLKPVSTVDTELKNGSSNRFLSLTLGNTQNPEMNTASSDEYSLKPGFDTGSIVTTELENGSSDDFLSLTLGNSQNPETITASSDGVIVSISAISDGYRYFILSLLRQELQSHMQRI